MPPFKKATPIAQAAAKAALGSGPKLAFGSPAWRAKYGKGKAKAPTPAAKQARVEAKGVEVAPAAETPKRPAPTPRAPTGGTAKGEPVAAKPAPSAKPVAKADAPEPDLSGVVSALEGAIGKELPDADDVKLTQALKLVRQVQASDTKAGT